MMSWTCLSVAEAVADFLAPSAQCPTAHSEMHRPKRLCCNCEASIAKIIGAVQFFILLDVMARLGRRRASIGTAPEMRRLAEPFLHAPSERSTGRNQLLILADRTAAGRSERVEARSVKELKEQECRLPVSLR
ncbi:hypothetical protein [Mesorhizobium sp. M0207]|uniref:hypothetical protein n=1 Tax=Mesorhizobium sp. M0207 TaxID=2956915 RepID=UPI003336562E